MEAKVLSVRYHIPEVIISTNDYKAFRKYLESGFSAGIRKNGYCTLRKRSQILVTLQYEGSEYTVNLKSKIISYYGKENTFKLTEKFKEDLENNKVTIKKDSNGYFSIFEK